VGTLAELKAEARIVALLGDPDPTVRATALEALGESAALPTAAVAAAIDSARADGAMNDVRLAGIRILLARAKASAVERPQVVEALSRLAADRDALVRREAADALAALGEPRPELGPLDTGRDLAAYRQIVLQTVARSEGPVTVEIVTERGAFAIELAARDAPTTSLSFLQLVRRGYFDGQLWHRVVPDFVAQTGDPRGDGWGGPGYTLRDEINRRRYVRGAVGMALSGPDTGGSQFFVTLAPQPHLDGDYAVFGQVVDGLAVVDALRQGDRIVSARERAGPGGLGRGASGALR
jgi:cyclophilin family peptidyl-prolyl cis-trans isomerase